MSDDRTPVTGPIPIYVETTPAAVVLDMAALTRLVVGDVLDALLHPEDTTAWDRLHELADGPAVSDDRLPYEELVAQLAAAASSKVPLYGTKALELAEHLTQAAGPKPVPNQVRRAS
ncbi:hypothetical protein AB0D99_10435 [Streptomyces sp. NPDC047971]|uniref:hypothetical protein n=1 Tax=Streptomyces sp. NPDC047971 TaxID=3154499 RepID=UPI00340BADA1